MNYKFNYNGKEFILDEENLLDVINDEENPLKGLEIEDIINLLKESPDVDFDKAYYSTPCEECNSNFKDSKKESEYLEYYFYIYSKDSNYVISTISKEYENKTYNRMEIMGEVDNSYIVTIIVCANCSKYLVQIEQLEV